MPVTELICTQKTEAQKLRDLSKVIRRQVATPEIFSLCDTQPTTPFIYVLYNPIVKPQFNSLQDLKKSSTGQIGFIDFWFCKHNIKKICG